MKVIQPALFSVIKNFPELREEVVRLFKHNEEFKAVCVDYQNCVKAIKYWSRFPDREASKRAGEYESLRVELEEEILQSLVQRNRDAEVLM